MTKTRGRGEEKRTTALKAVQAMFLVNVRKKERSSWCNCSLYTQLACGQPTCFLFSRSIRRSWKSTRFPLPPFLSLFSFSFRHTGSIKTLLLSFSLKSLSLLLSQELGLNPWLPLSLALIPCSLSPLRLPIGLWQDYIPEPHKMHSKHSTSAAIWCARLLCVEVCVRVFSHQASLVYSHV